MKRKNELLNKSPTERTKEQLKKLMNEPKTWFELSISTQGPLDVGLTNEFSVSLLMLKIG
jgi:hypothetical protein